MTVRVGDLSVTVPDVAHSDRLRVAVGDLSVSAGSDVSLPTWIWSAIAPLAAWLWIGRKRKAA